MGTKGRPYYRIVAAPSAAGRSGRFVEQLGNYDPLKEPSLVNMDKERMMHWLTNGASASETLVRLLKKEGVWTDFEGTKPGKKARRKPVKARVKTEKPVRIKKKKAKPVEEAPAAEAVAETAAPAPEEAPVEA